MDKIDLPAKNISSSMAQLIPNKQALFAIDVNSGKDLKIDKELNFIEVRDRRLIKILGLEENHN